MFIGQVTHMKTWQRFILVMAMVMTTAARAVAVDWVPQKGETIVVLGNTFAERMMAFGYFESALHAQYPEHNLRVRSMAWSADEITLQPRPYLFGKLEDKLAQPKGNVDPKEVWFDGVGADSLILCFGMNESFKGEAGLPKFRADLDAYLKNHLAQKYNGKTAPRLLLISPIAHENLGKPLPDGVQHNKDLAKYVSAMAEVAAANKVPFINLFQPHTEWIKRNPKEKLTFNGIHQSEEGDWVFSQWIAQQLGWFDGKLVKKASPEAEKLRAAIAWKNDRFWIHFRAVNGEYIYGRRRQIWAQKVPMVEDAEMRRLWQVDEDADQVLFKLKKPVVAAVWGDHPAKTGVATEGNK